MSTEQSIESAAGVKYTVSRVHGVVVAGNTANLASPSAGKKAAIFAIEIELAAGASFTITEETSGTVLYRGALSKTFDTSSGINLPFILANTAGKKLILSAVAASVTYTAVVGVEE